MKPSKGNRPARGEILVAGALWLVGILVRVWNLDSVPAALYNDEVSAAYIPHLQGNGEYPLGSFRETLLYMALGTRFLPESALTSEVAVRISAAIYGSLILPIIFAIARLLFSPLVAMVSLGLAIFMPILFHFSRYQVPSMAYAFWTALGMLLLIAVCKRAAKGNVLSAGGASKGRAASGGAEASSGGSGGWGARGSKGSNNPSVIWLGLAASGLALAFASNLVLIGRVFLILVAPFMALYFIRSAARPFRVRGSLVLVAALVVGSGPWLWDTANPPERESTFSGYTVPSAYHGPAEILAAVLKRVAWHLGPDFLMLTGGAAHATHGGFQEGIQDSNLETFGTSRIGALGYIGGFLAYVGLAMAGTRLVVGPGRLPAGLLISWVLAVVFSQGVALYDNPNSSRSIPMAPALAIVASLPPVWLLGRGLNRRHLNSPMIRRAAPFALVLILAVAQAGTYLPDYFGGYPERSAGSFDYGVKEAVGIIDANGLSTRPTLIHYGNSSRFFLTEHFRFYSVGEELMGREITSLDLGQPLSPIRSYVPGTILITRFPSDLKDLTYYGVPHREVGSVRLPDGRLNMWVVELQADEMSTAPTATEKFETQDWTRNWSFEGQRPQAGPTGLRLGVVTPRGTWTSSYVFSRAAFAGWVAAEAEIAARFAEVDSMYFGMTPDGTPVSSSPNGIDPGSSVFCRLVYESSTLTLTCVDNASGTVSDSTEFRVPGSHAGKSNVTMRVERSPHATNSARFSITIDDANFTWDTRVSDISPHRLFVGVVSPISSPEPPTVVREVRIWN